MSKKILQVILYIPIQIVFIPFAIVGLIVGVYKEMHVSKKMGVSYSAGQTLQYRWVMHYFNIRPDYYSVAFTRKFPCESHFGLWSVYGALIISQRLFGFKTTLSKLPEKGKETVVSTAGARVVMFDKILEKYVDEMEQIVIPGVGFDMIALHFTEGKDVKVFELDQTNTIHIKLDTLKKAGIKYDWINYIPVDYDKESWKEKLLEAGFDKTKKTLFLWQSVSHFLDAETVKETLKQMAEISPEGSIIVQDFYSEAFAKGEYSKVASKPRNMMAKMGEPWKFGIDMKEDPKAAVEEFLIEYGLKMTTFNLFGEKLNIEPFYCIVVAET